MTIRLGVIMDPIETINYKKDSTLAMLLEAARRDYELWYLGIDDIFLLNGIPYGHATRINVFANPDHYFERGEIALLPLSELQILLMRKDPPFNEKYIYATYILEHAERLGTRVINRPQSLRDANEKLFATYFPHCCPKSIVTSKVNKLHEFWAEYGDIVCKPLNTMGGVAVFRVQQDEVNANVIFETLTSGGTNYIIAQRYIPEIVSGDKRIILINGVPVPYALARIPQGADWRGNLAVGAKGVIQPLSARDQYICAQLKDELRKRGLYFVGIDVIGDYLTEVNVTSPTGIREIESSTNYPITKTLFDCIEQL